MNGGDDLEIRKKQENDNETLCSLTVRILCLEETCKCNRVVAFCTLINLVNVCVTYNKKITTRTLSVSTRQGYTEAVNFFVEEPNRHLVKKISQEMAWISERAKPPPIKG